MNPFVFSFFLVISYLFGWGFYLTGDNNSFYYIMFIFALLNVLAITHPAVFHYGFVRPLQLGTLSAGFLKLFTGDFAFFLFSILLVAVLAILEREDILPKDKNQKPITLYLTLKRVAATIIMPFSVTYVVLIFRPYESIQSLLIVLFYFALLYVSSKWFKTITSFGIFCIAQMILFVYVIEWYLAWSSLQVTTFFVGIVTVLVIGYWREGLFAQTRK